MQRNHLFSRVVLSAVVACFAGLDLYPARVTGAEPSQEFQEQLGLFFKKHCLDCHDAESKQGRLSLEKPDFAMHGRAQTDLWTRIYDRVARGEMPPADSPKPARAEVESFLGVLRPTLAAADRAQREVVERRLNRIEYQNTIHDLLAVDIELQNLLPEDQQAGGFDNNGEALAVSTEQMQGYLEAARGTIDAAITLGERPKTETFQVDAIDEVKQYFGQGTYDFVDERIVIHTSSDNSEYSKVSTRSKRVPTRGKYRFRFQAATFASPSPLCFTVTASTFDAHGVTQRNLGYFEVGAEPKTFEIETTMDAKGAIQFFPLGLPTWLNKKPGVVYAGVGFGEVEVTGPIIEAWPPECHTRLLGTTDLKTGTLDDAKRILRSFVPRAFRRAASDEEVARYTDLVATRLASGRTFHESLRAALIGVLCSPHFLYLNEDKPAGDSDRVSDTELAARLAYFLWSAPPDRELLDLAAEKRLHTPEVLKAQVERMLKSPKSEAFVKNFTGQWLHLRQLGETTPDVKLYPKFDELLQESMAWESEGFFREMLREDISIDDVLDSDWAMLNERLARHYEIDGVAGLALRKVSLPTGSVRGGVLTQAAVLKVTANGTTTSPVTRGVWVLENILGRPTPPPPPNTAGIEPDIRGAVTVREQLAKHRNVESCNVCHKSIDPPGFALESFDPTGAFRENYLRWHVTNVEHNWGRVEKAAKVDTAGETESGERFADIRDFKKLLLTKRDDFAHCLTEKILSYALGREMGFGDRESISEITTRTRADGNGLRTLIHAIVSSKTFATR
ncbi:MAG: DUF1592 domain-containing protein [Planctomycetia bacterium]|nr:DUF1592 domain-containing protein [Planctomycetia bacterium]